MVLHSVTIIMVLSFCVGAIVGFKKRQYIFNENDGNAVVEVVLSGDIAVDVTVSVSGSMFRSFHQFMFSMPLLSLSDSIISNGQCNGDVFWQSHIYS